jgi:outer membrane autotransporter protein
MAHMNCASKKNLHRIRFSPTGIHSSSPRTVLRHGSRISLPMLSLTMSLMLAFPGSSYAGGAAGGNAPGAPSSFGGGAGGGYHGASGSIFNGGDSSADEVTPGGSTAGAAGTGGSHGGGGGAVGSFQRAPGNLTSTVTGGNGGAGGSGGGGGGGDGAVLTSGGVVNVAVTGGIGGFGPGGGGGGGGAGIVYTSPNTSLTIARGVTGGIGGAGSAGGGGGGGGSGVWVTSNGAVNVTTGTVTGGNGGAGFNSFNIDGFGAGEGGAGVVFSSTGGQLQVDSVGQVRGGTASGNGTGGAGVNIISGNVMVTVDNGAVIAGGAGGTASGSVGPQGVGGAGSGGAAGGNTGVVQTGTGGIGIVAAGGNNTIVTSGAINGATGLAGQANAIVFSGGNNTLELQAGYSFTGDVVSTSGAVNGDTLALGGATNASFDASSLVAAASGSSPTTQYAGFNTLSKTGASTWTLTGVNTFTGTTNVVQGTLQAGNANAFSAASAVSVAGNATLDLNSFNQTIASLAGAGNVTLGNATLTTGGDNSSTTFDGVISGAGGSLTKTGNGTFILTGANSYSGNTTISAGILQVGAGGASGALGAGAVIDDAALVFQRSDALTVANVISGSGNIVQNGGGNLILTGANSYSGSTTISAGVLQVGDGGASGSLGTGAVIDNAALVFNRSDALTVANVISGSGSVAQNGGGNLILTGANLYTGPTAINSGTLSVNGSIVSDTTISNGGTLGGNGTVGNVNVASGGVLAPDNSVGTLHVNGNLTFNTGAIYRIQADAAGNADRTDVTGNATLAGTVDVQAGSGNYAPNTSYTILSDTGVQSGAFAGVTSDLAFLTPTLIYQPHAVMLDLARNNISFADVAGTNNQRGVANVLQNVASGATGDIGTVVNAVTNLSAGQARTAFDAMSGAGLSSMRRANQSFVSGFGNQVLARLNVAGADDASDVQQAAFDTPVLLAANDHVSDLMPMLAQQSYSMDGGVPDAVPASNRGFWLRGYGSDQSTAGDANAAGSRQKDVGISAGIDARVNDHLVVGVALTHDHAEVDAADQNGNSNGNAVALYAGYASGPWNVNGVLSYAHNSNGTQRRIAFGDIDRTAMGDFGSRTVSLYGDVTYDVPLGGWTLQPLAGLSLSSNQADAYSETGADALNLQVAGQTVHSTKSLFGAKALIDIRKVQLQPRLIWAHEFGDADSAAMTAQLQGAPTPFAINGVDVPRDSLIAGVTVSGQASERVAVFADVQEEFNSQQNNLGLLVGLRASW